MYVTRTIDGMAASYVEGEGRFSAGHEMATTMLSVAAHIRQT
jgi:hypothetical protein